MNEMEANLQQTKMEQDAKVKIAEIEAKNRLDLAKKNKPRRDIYWNGVIAGILIVLTILGVVGGIVFHSVNDDNNKAAQIARCEEGGGVWTPRIQRIYDPGARTSGDQHDEWYYICVKK